MPTVALADADLAALVSDGATALQIPLTRAQADLFVAYVRLVERWNGAYNLTAVHGPRAMVVHHVLDCLAVVGPLRRQMASSHGGRLLDVGSGAGLPGLVIALVEPALKVVCVDSVGKKAAFITQAAGALGLKNLTAQHRRVEDLTGPPFDVIASRAFASLANFYAATLPMLGESGVWMAMKGKVPADEMADSSGFTFHVEQLGVPGLDADRCIVWARPINKK